LSPLLWKKVAKGLSAGRVQSVALRLIVQRERQIEGFVPQEYWKIEAELKRKQEPGEVFSAELVKCDGKKFIPENQESVQKIIDELQQQKYSVAAVRQKRNQTKSPAAVYYQHAAAGRVQ
jgi:DNA topoisomerase I (EC 5.99.1.2)